jgi:enoyl-CoA hydratase
MDDVTCALDGPVAVMTLSRPERRNAVDRPTATHLYKVFKRFDTDPPGTRPAAASRGEN